MIDYNKIKSALSDEGRSELCTLFEPHTLQHLCSNLESLKDEHPDDSLIKILWNYCQLEADTLPIAFIASSLLDMVQNEQILKKHPKISFLVCQHSYMKLINEGELRSAIYLIKDFIIDTNSKFFDSEDEFRNIQSSTIESITKESQEAIKRREGSAYIHSLDQLAAQVRKAKPPKIKGSKALPITTSGDASPPAFILGTQTPTTEETFKVDRTDSDKTPSTLFEARRSYVPKIIYYLILLSIFAGAVFALYPDISNLKSLISNNDFDHTVIYEANLDSDLLIPQRTSPKAFTLDSLGPNLDDINKRLAKLGTQKEQTKKDEGKSKQDDSKSIDYSEVESLNTVPDSSASAPANAQGTPPPHQSTPIPKLPSAPSNMGVPVDLGNTTQTGRNQGTTIDPNKIKKTPDGRLYGPPEIQDPTKGKNAQRALDGSVLQSYEVERFDPPLVFETITATNVLAAPSLMSQTITRLVSSTPIHVTAKMGLWLELRSNEGKIGYIFTQDAVEKK